MAVAGRDVVRVGLDKAEGRDRQSLLRAVKQRHCYAATDNILVDFRCGQKIMGDDAVVNGAPIFDFHVVGTGKIAKIDVLRDSAVIETLKLGAVEYKGAWTDPNPRDGTHYYRFSPAALVLALRSNASTGSKQRTFTPNRRITSRSKLMSPPAPTQ